MSFAKGVEDFNLKFIEASEETVRAVSLKLFSAIIYSSPVDTGRFRGNWYTTNATPSASVDYSKLDKSGNSAIKGAEKVVLSSEDWDTFLLTNNLPYAERLEFGYSNQASQGMVRTNVARFKSLLEREAKKALPK